MKTQASRQILDLDRYNFLLVAPMVMILVFLKTQCRELSKNVYFYFTLAYSLRVMILSSKTCHDTPNLSEPPLNTIMHSVTSGSVHLEHICHLIFYTRFVLGVSSCMDLWTAVLAL